METKNMIKYDKAAHFFHIINTIITIILLIFSVLSFFYIGKDIASNHSDNEFFMFLLRCIISTLAFITALISLLTGVLLPNKPYFLNTQQQDNIKKVTKTSLIIIWLSTLFKFTSKKGDMETLVKAGASSTILANASDTKFIRKIWVWWFPFIMFVFIFSASWFLFSLSYNNNQSKTNLIMPFIDNYSSSTYNSLCVIMIICLLLLIIFSMLWRIVVDKCRKNDKFWRKEPIVSVFFSFIYIALMVAITMHFNLNYLGMTLLVIVTMVLGYFIESKLNSLSKSDNKRRIFSNTPYIDNSVEHLEKDKLYFEERKK